MVRTCSTVQDTRQVNLDLFGQALIDCSASQSQLRLAPQPSVLEARQTEDSPQLVARFHRAI